MKLLKKAISMLVLSSLVLSSCTNDATTTSTDTKPTAKLSSVVTPKRFLFDATKAETAGNADWVISENTSGTPLRYPNPLQSTVTATTAENYWRGALSSWGIALVKAGHSVETLAPGASITYGNTSNPQDLSNYDVYVVDEPNTLFTAAQKTAIMNFVKNGGGLFMISDHDVSDRNNDGKDSPAIWNDLMSTNSVKTNPFGITITQENFAPKCIKIKQFVPENILF